MILVDNQIQDRVENFIKYENVYCEGAKVLIENFKTENLQSASYDLTITNKIRKFKDDFKRIKLSDKDDIDNSFEEKDISLGYNLRSGEYILVQVNEYINMPNDLTAHIRPRTTFTRLGLIISCQHMNPSYSGKLHLGLYNATPFVVEITPNLVIGQIIFEKLDKAPNEDNLYCKKSSKYQNENEFVGSKVYDELKDDDKKIVDDKIKKILQDLRK